LVETGRSADGIIEAVEAPDHAFAVGVQWHPEELVGGDARARRLFAAFVEASTG
jgi:putative glutamine amidotransferase